MARGIPVPYESIPQTSTQLGRFQPTEGLRGFNTDASASIASAGATVRSDARGFAAQFQGVSELARGVRYASDAWLAMKTKENEAIAIRQEHDAKLAMDRTEAEIQIEIMNEPDQTKWAGIAAARRKALSETLFDPSHSPMAKEAINARFKDWDGRHDIGIQVSAAKRSYQKAGESIKAEIIRAVDREDFETAASVLNDGHTQGYIPADDAARMMGQMTERALANGQKKLKEAKESERESFQQILLEDPWKAREMLDANDPNNEGRNTWFPNLDAGDRLQMQHAADAEARRKQADTVETLQDGIVMGSVDDTSIEQMAPVARLGPVDVEKLKQFRAKYIEAKTSKEPMSDVDAMDLSADIEKFNPDKMDEADALTTWVDLKRRADVITARGGEIGRQTGGVFNQRLYQLHPLHDRRKKTADLPDGVESDFNDLMRTYAPAPVPSSDSGKSEAEKEKARQEHRMFITQRSRLFEDLKKEVQTNPDILDPTKGGVDGWIANKWKGVRAASRLPALPGPDATLFPAGSADPNEMFKSILK